MSGAYVDKAATDDGSTPLYITAQNGHPSTVEKLIAAGADVDKAVTDGRTPLWMAAQGNRIAVFEKMIAAGADMDKSIRGFCNETPLEAAQRMNHAAVTTLLA